MKRKLLSTLLLTSLLIISGCGKQDGRTDSWGQPQSYTEIAEKLKNFGITGITDELIQNLESDYAQLPPDVEFDKTANLLTAVGAGTFNAATGTWTPATNGVYCFDIEIYNLTTMYTDFLLGVSSLDKEELDFQNITEDTSQVNWEGEKGQFPLPGMEKAIRWRQKCTTTGLTQALPTNLAKSSRKTAKTNNYFLQTMVTRNVSCSTVIKNGQTISRRKQGLCFPLRHSILPV